MKVFSQKGSVVAGFVGVLSLVLLVGITAFGLYSYENSRTSNKIVAGDGAEDMDLGLKVDSTTPLVVSWTGPLNWDSKARYLVEVSQPNGSPVAGNHSRLVDGSAKNASFPSLSLPIGQYQVQMQYIPPSGPILKDTQDFTVSSK